MPRVLLISWLLWFFSLYRKTSLIIGFHLPSIFFSGCHYFGKWQATLKCFYFWWSRLLFDIWLKMLILIRFYLVIFRERKGGRKRETDTSVWKRSFNWLHKRSLSHAPWPETEPATKARALTSSQTLHLAEQCPTNWATPLRARSLFFG